MKELGPVGSANGQYILPLKTGDLGDVLVMGGLCDPLDQSDPFIQRYPVSFNSKIYRQTNNLVRWKKYDPELNWDSKSSF